MVGELIIPAFVVERLRAERIAAAATMFRTAIQDEVTEDFRTALLEMRPKCIPVIELRDLVFTASVVTGQVYLRHVLGPRQRITPPTYLQVSGMAYAALAGIVPEWIEEIGFDSLDLARLVMVVRGRPTAAEMAEVPRERHPEVLADWSRTEALALGAFDAFTAVAAPWFERYWIEPIRDPSKRPHLDTVCDYLAAQFAVPRMVPHAQSQRALARAVRGRDPLDQRETKEIVDEAYNAHWVRSRSRKPGDPLRIAFELGPDLRMRPRLTDFKDAHRAAARERPWLHPDTELAEKVAGETERPLPTLHNQQAPLDDAQRREAVDLARAAMAFATAADLDEQDRRLFTMVSEGRSFAEIGRLIGRSEKAVRLHRDRLAGSLIRLAPDELKPYFRGLAVGA